MSDYEVKKLFYCFKNLFLCILKYNKLKKRNQPMNMNNHNNDNSALIK